MVFSKIFLIHFVVFLFHSLTLLFYKPSISLTNLSEILTVPTRTSILNINSPIYFHTIVTAAASESITGGLAAKSEKIIQASIIITPSKQTAAYPFRKLFPTFCVGSPPKLAKAIGEIAVYK